MVETVSTTLEDVLALLDQASLAATRRRDLVSAVNRICAMAGAPPKTFPADPPLLRKALSGIRPAAHGITDKSFANLKSLFASALQIAGVADPLGRGKAKRDPAWAPLIEALADDKRLANGLATFASWCADRGISPTDVGDDAVQQFLSWLETRTHYPQPRKLARQVPRLWNEASSKLDSWPGTKLTLLSFRAPSKHLKWSELSPSFGQDVDRYLALRANPDLFDDRPEAPRRPLAATTLCQQREHLRLAASILAQDGKAVTSLADLTSPDRFKTILRHYHNQANGELC